MIILVFVISGLIGAFWASSKNKNPFLWGILCFLFPVIGLIFLAFAKDEQSIEEKTANAITSALQNSNALVAQPVLSSADNARWEALVKYDDEIKHAVARLTNLSEDAAQEFKVTFLALNDKSKIPIIVSDIETDFLENSALRANNNKLDELGMNVQYLFRTKNGYAATMKNGRALAFSQGSYRIFQDLNAFRLVSADSSAWPEIIDKNDKRVFFAEAAEELRKHNEKYAS